MEPCKTSRNRLVAERWLDGDGSFSSEAVARALDATQSAKWGSNMTENRIGDGTEVLTLNGKCDLSTALHTEQRIVSALDAGTSEIIFDLRGVTSIGCSMLHVLFRALLRMGRNGRVVLVRPSPHVWAFFEESGLDKGFSTFPNLEDALAEVSVPRGPRKSLEPWTPFPQGLSGTR
jgi:anti-anti-sigma factor